MEEKVPPENRELYPRIYGILGVWGQSIMFAIGELSHHEPYLYRKTNLCRVPL